MSSRKRTATRSGSGAIRSGSSSKGSNKRSRPSGKAEKSNVNKGLPGVVWNKNDCAPQLNISKDGMTVSGEKGYRMVRANAGVREGHFYYECEILPPSDGCEGHVRLGWAAITGELQAPVGYDKWSYAYRDTSGSRVHQSERYDDYGESFAPGDIIGCAIYLKPPIIPHATGNLVGSSYSLAPAVAGASLIGGGGGVSRMPPELGIGRADGGAGSFPPEFSELSRENHIRFYKNGVDQGVAYRNIPSRSYYPAVSVYMGGRVRANFGPTWLLPPTGAIEPAGGSKNGHRVDEMMQAGSVDLTGRRGGVSHRNVAVSNAPGNLSRPPGFLRAVADLKPLPTKTEIQEHAQMILERRAALSITVKSKWSTEASSRLDVKLSSDAGDNNSDQMDDDHDDCNGNATEVSIPSETDVDTQTAATPLVGTGT